MTAAGPLEQLASVLLLQGGHNTVVVMLGAAMLGIACGTVGVFTLLRRRALVSDAVAHATLPGLAAGFLFGAAWGLPVRSPVLLLGGAASAAVLAMVAVQWLSERPRVTEDTATAAVLAGSFGLGIALLSVVQVLRTGGQAGLDAYLLGATAGMLESEARLMAALAGGVVLAVVVTFKELAAVSFDPLFARASGLPVRRLDALVAALSLATVVVGLRVVGLVLIVAMLVIPPAAARFWSHRIGLVAVISAGIGASSAYLGAALSAIAPNLPTGAVIVVTAAALFVASLLFGTAGGLASRAFGQRKVSRPRPPPRGPSGAEQQAGAL